MAVSTVAQPWEFTAQGDVYVPDAPLYGNLNEKLRPYIERLVLVAAAAGTLEVSEASGGQTLTGLVTVAGAGAPVVIEIKRAVKGIFITALTGTGNKVLAYTGWPAE